MFSPLEDDIRSCMTIDSVRGTSAFTTTFPYHLLSTHTLFNNHFARDDRAFTLDCAEINDKTREAISKVCGTGC